MPPSPIDANNITKLDYFKNFRGLTGGSKALTDASGQTAAITADFVDFVVIPAASEAVVFLAAGANPTATTSGYPVAVNQSYRIPWVSGDKLAGICLSTETATLYYCPVQ